MQVKTKMTLCWDCANACGGCSWSSEFRPVDGWEATPTRVKVYRWKYGGIKEVDSFHVTKCPLFKDDTKQYSRRGY